MYHLYHLDSICEFAMLKIKLTNRCLGAGTWPKIAADFHWQEQGSRGAGGLTKSEGGATALGFQYRPGTAVTTHHLRAQICPRPKPLSADFRVRHLPCVTLPVSRNTAESTISGATSPFFTHYFSYSCHRISFPGFEMQQLWVMRGVVVSVNGGRHCRQHSAPSSF